MASEGLLHQRSELVANTDMEMATDVESSSSSHILECHASSHAIALLIVLNLVLS